MLLKSLSDAGYVDVRQVLYAKFGYSNYLCVLILNVSREFGTTIRKL
jgi:hypothetical protein